MSLKNLVTSLLVCLWLMAPLHTNAADEAVLVEVPFPDVNELDPRVRRIVEPAMNYFKRMQPILSDVELGREYGRLGMVFQAFRMQEAAGASHRNAMQLDPTNPRWTYLSAIYNEETGNLEAALALYRKVQVMAPDYPNTLVRIGRVSLETGNLEEASEAFSNLLEQQPELAAPALSGLGTIALRERRLEEAIDLLERALVLQPQATQIHYRLAQAYRQLGNTDKAREHLEKRGDRIAWAPDPWVEEMKTRARHPSYYVQQGIEAVKQGEMERAAMHLDLALALDPENVEALTRMAALVGLNARRMDAEFLIDKALQLDPEHGLANSLKGALLAERRQFKEAQAYQFRAVNAEPGNFDFRVQFANGLMRLEDYGAAAAQYEEALALKPEDASTRYGHAVALTLAGECGAAMQTIERGVRANPRVALTLNARARLYATCPAANDAQRKLALEDALLLYDQRPNGEYAETVAMAMAANGRFEEAMDYQGQAIFEAIKTGDSSSQEGMRANMQRYEARSVASAVWPELVNK